MVVASILLAVLAVNLSFLAMLAYNVAGEMVSEPERADPQYYIRIGQGFLLLSACAQGVSLWLAFLQ